MVDLINLNTAFNHINYIDDGHKYIDVNNNEYYISVTSLLGSLKEKFDSVFWSKYKALEASGYKVKNNKNGTITVYHETDELIINPYFDDLSKFDLSVTQQAILNQWSIANKIGTSRGSILHNYLESLLQRKTCNYELPYFVTFLPTVETIKYIKSVEILQNLAKDFYEKIIKNNYIVVAQEFVIGDSDYKLAGTFDLLLYNIKTKEYELWDYKTDKKFNKSSLNKLNYFLIDDCEYNKYSLQLGIYKNIVEKNTILKINKCFVVHFDYKKEKYSIIETLNYDEEINNFLNHGKNKSAYF